MSRFNFKRREAGFSVVEAAVSGFVVAVSVAGLVVSVCYGRQLERSTADTWRATSAATAALEQIRSASKTQWSGVSTEWDGHICSESGFGDPIGDKMVTTVVPTRRSSTCRPACGTRARRRRTSTS